MDVIEEPKVEAPQGGLKPDMGLGLGMLLTELQALATMLPIAERSDAEIESDFDNLPV